MVYSRTAFIAIVLYTFRNITGLHNLALNDYITTEINNHNS